MKLLLYLSFLICLCKAVPSICQSTPILTRKYSTVDDTGQKISFELPTSWSFKDGVIRNSRKAKLGAFTTGILAEYPCASGTDFIKQLKAGYPDDVGNPKFVGSRVISIGKRTWTEGIRNVPLWDGKRNANRWYTHDFFTTLNGQSFLITFYSLQKELPEEQHVKQVLASVKLL